MLILIFLFPLWAKTVHVLPTVEIAPSSTSLRDLRSVDWPAQTFDDSPLFENTEIDTGINSLNGLQSRTQGSPTFSIRGSAQSGRALVLVDDIPLNFSSGFGASPIFFPKEMIESVAVIKGPASLFYGSQALAGSINFVTRTDSHWNSTFTASDTNDSFLPGRPGSLAHNSLHISAPLVHSKGAHLQASFFTESDDGQFPYQTQNGSGVRQFNAQNLSRFLIKGEKSLRNMKLGFQSVIGRQIIQSPGPINSPITTRQETEGLLVSGKAHYFFTDEQSLLSRLSYLQSDANFLALSQPTQTHQQTWIWQNQYIYDISNRTKLQIFADFSSHHLDSSFSGDGRSMDQFELGPLFSFRSTSWMKHQIGGRYLVSQNRFLPSLIQHFYFYDLESWLSYSQGFKNPTLSDRYSTSSQFQPNPNLREEQSQQWELGIKSNTSGTWHFDARIFHLQYSNFIQTLALTPQTYTRVNQGRGFSRGFDLELRGLWRKFESYVRYNYLDTENQETGQPFRLSPTHQSTLGFVFQWLGARWESQTNFWQETYDLQNNQAVRLSDWHQWNFFVHKDVTQSWSMSLGLINAFNQGKELTLFYPEPQRRYWLQMRYTFQN